MTWQELPWYRSGVKRQGCKGSQQDKDRKNEEMKEERNL
jgi:hypothetical protein